jgi:hypothetical protein
MATERSGHSKFLSEALEFCIGFAWRLMWAEEAPVAVQALKVLIRGDRRIPSRLLELGSMIGATQLEVGDDLCKKAPCKSIAPTLNQSVPETMRDGSPLLRPIV